MVYEKREDLPDSVKNVLPAHAQDIYKEAYNNALEQYQDPEKRKQGGSQEEAAHRVAWNAVKQKYEKGDDGNWHPKG